MVPVASAPAIRCRAKDYPLTLVFGNSTYYWNQNVLIQHSETLKREYRILLLDYPDGFVEMNQDDAKQLAVRDGEKIRLCTASGSAVVAARVTPEMRSGTVFRAVLCPSGAAANPRIHGQRRPVGARSRGKGGRLKARILNRADVLKIVDLLRQQGYEVIAPSAGGDATRSSTR